MDPAKPPEHRVVLFVDLLGFAALTEQFDIDLNSIKAFDRPGTWTMDLIQRAYGNRLTRAFGGFHRSLRGAIALAQMDHPLTAITFSDSAFIATQHLAQAAKFAVGLIQSLLQQRIPARMGIASGSFAAVRFRSDVEADGGDHAAHFLGTGVVRSHATESCGISGMRILLHPTAVALCDQTPNSVPGREDDFLHVVECSEDECANPLGIRYELDYWRLRPTVEAATWHALQDMWKSSPEFAERHYEATAHAINRMRVCQGAASLSNLRRRTLPRFDRPIAPSERL